MNDKRFVLDDEENGLCRCILVDGEEIPTCEICDLLNKLYEENEQLKQENDKYRVMINANASLNDEVYEQLKKTEKSYKECREENEQLRKELKKQKLLNESLGLFMNE